MYINSYLTLLNHNSAPLSAAVPSSPSLDINSMTFAQILIQSNDNANGILELSPLSVTLYENHTGPVVNVVRRGGLFGEVRMQLATWFEDKSLDEETGDVISTQQHMISVL